MQGEIQVHEPDDGVLVAGDEGAFKAVCDSGPFRVTWRQLSGADAGRRVGGALDGDRNPEHQVGFPDLVAAWQLEQGTLVENHSWDEWGVGLEVDVAQP